ncbi:MAG TPA: DUF1961 family protein [Chthoniobacteraceae bacterium]|nr:DUF1961 family protein [Chthoniobacteraceae bacterium]
MKPLFSLLLLFMITSQTAAIADLLKPIRPEAVETVPGPRAGLTGYRSATDTAASLRLSEPLGDRGSVAFWFKLERDHASQPGAEQVARRLLECPGVFHVEFKARSSHVELLWKWEDKTLLINQLRPILPSLPGDQWIHFAVSWDAKAGLFNGWLNGTPLREEGTKVIPWEPSQPIAALRVHFGPVALAGLETSATLPDEKQRAQTVGDALGTLDALLGAGERTPVDWKEKKGALFYSNDFARPGDLDDWVAEGPMQTTFEHGWMQMQSTLPEDLPRGHVVLWLKKELPENFLAEWEMKPVNDRGLCIAFFSARGRNGESIFSETLRKRNGEFPLYHSGDIDCYHISYYANTPETPGRLTSNLRKNHGFYLISNGPPGISAHSREWNRVQLLKVGDHIQLAVNGRRIIDHTDDGKRHGPVLGGGAFGLRQMVWTVGGYRNFRVHHTGP